MHPTSALKTQDDDVSWDRRGFESPHSPMSQRAFERFCHIARERAGIEIGAGKEPLVTVRVGRRLRALGISSPEQYLHMLEHDARGEMVHFLDAISTNVTSFFREPAHFDVLADALKGWQASRHQRLFRLWSAASSSGEEAYSLAMTCRETLRAGSQFRILATDISTVMLRRGLAARYSADAVRTVPAAYRSRYLTPVWDEDIPSYEVCEELRSRVIFERVNLAEPPLPVSNPVDCVLCRNVMMYFSRPVRQALVREIERILRPGGLLMIGHAETLIGLKTRLRLILPSVFVKEVPCRTASGS